MPYYNELTGDNSGDRADIFISRELGVTRAYAQKLIKSGGILNINRPSYKIKAGEVYSININPANPANPEKLEYPENFEIEPEPVDFGVIYDDKDIAVINKPAGLVTHPAPGNWHGTLAQGLLYKYPDMKLLNKPCGVELIKSKLRPGIVHRLDAVTSGLMVAARSQRAYEVLTRMFQGREVTKKYLALVHGEPVKRDGILSGAIGRDPDNPLKMAVIDVNDGGRPALTGYKVLWAEKNYSLIICTLFTGRTHQIRVHMAALGHVLFGDTLYGAPEEDLDLLKGLKKGSNLVRRIFLHSWRLEFRHPVSGELMKFCLPLTEELGGCLAAIRKTNK